MNDIDTINPCALSDNDITTLSPALNRAFNITGITFLATGLLYLLAHCF